MRRILDRIALHARQRPAQPALTDGRVDLSYADLVTEVERVAGLIDCARVALLLANGSHWAVLDLALIRRGAVCIPLPPFFSDAQIAHVLADARPGLVITDQPGRLRSLVQASPALELSVAGRPLSVLRLSAPGRDRFPEGAAKLTYTSGTTGQPKGVCLSAAAIAEVAVGLSDAVRGRPGDRALALLPLSTLLENIGGLYAPLYSGAHACLPDLAECGIHGSSGLDAGRLAAALMRHRPSTTILVPQLLKALVACAEAGAPMPDSLRFVAVGGARSAPQLIERAHRLGLPAFEGYGLSEAASVVSLNLPGAERPGSVGRPLPHARVRIADDGEVVVAGPLFQGYLGAERLDAAEWFTGDLGHLDRDGYLYITGRKRDAYATAFGRNVSPDWVESELLASAAVLQAAVFGEGRSCNIAVLVPHPAADTATLAAVVTDANARLPDYAQVRGWIVADQPFTAANGLASHSGAINRRGIAQVYAAAIEKQFAAEESDALV